MNSRNIGLRWSTKKNICFQKKTDLVNIYFKSEVELELQIIIVCFSDNNIIKWFIQKAAT